MGQVCASNWIGVGGRIEPRLCQPEWWLRKWIPLISSANNVDESALGRSRIFQCTWDWTTAGESGATKSVAPVRRECKINAGFKQPSRGHFRTAASLAKTASFWARLFRGVLERWG